MEYLLEAENCLVAAQETEDPDKRAEFVRQAACYRNLAMKVMNDPQAQKTPRLRRGR